MKRNGQGWFAVTGKPPHIRELIQSSRQREGECGTWALLLWDRAKSGDPEAQARLKRELPIAWRNLQQELKQKRAGSAPRRASDRKEKRYGPQEE